MLSDTLDVTSDLLARFGNVMSGYHGQLKAAILPHLEEPRPVVRKRAIQCMGERRWLKVSQLVSQPVSHLLFHFVVSTSGCLKHSTPPESTH